jgi:two-component system, OmpR family, response regulator
MPEAIRVLLIDDEKLFVESLTKVLKRRGMVIRSAHDGQTGLELLAEAEPDVIVLDLRMPGLDGLATLEKIRVMDLLTPVILLTGHIDIDRVTQILNKGAAEVLLKPCPIDTLVSAIENACEMKAINKEMADNF